MGHLNPESFFDLDAFEHKMLFADCPFAWEALNRLEDYISKFTFTPISTKNFPGVTFVHPEQIFIGEGTKIEPGAYIEGPCILGKNCTVRHAAYLRKNVIAGNHCVIGHCVEMKHVILLNEAHIAHLSYVGDSIFGNKCNLGAGVKCANVKFDRTNIVVSDASGNYDSGLRKFGAVIGDRVQLGCNSVTNPGTLIGKESCLFPCTNFGGIAPANSMIHLPTKAVIYPTNKK